MDSQLSAKSSEFLKTAVAGAMKGYEPRAPQLDMMDTCARTIEESGILMAEAGTGTGKTFAYLIPIILSGRKAVVSTRTINLQEQLVSKDLGFLSGLAEFGYAIAKGRGNYLCRRRLSAFRANDDREEREYAELVRWAASTETGDLEDFGLRKAFIWDRVSSDPDACRGAKCGSYKSCFYFRARQRWERAQIVVANHSLMGVNALIPGDSKILPPADILVMDEAHALDGALTEVAGLTLSNTGFERVLNRFLRLDEKGVYKGLLSCSPQIFMEVETLRKGMALFWKEAGNRLEHRKTIRGAFPLRDAALSLSVSAGGLAEKIRTSTACLFQEDDELELKAALAKLKAYASGLEEIAVGAPGFVRWTEIDERRSVLRMSPVYPSGFMRQAIVPEYEAVILTSATLSVSGDFGFMTKVLGLEGAQTVAYPSPFDVPSQVEVLIKRGIDPRYPDAPERLAGVILEEAARKDGGILVLFTSRDLMTKTWDLCAVELGEMGLNPMVQGEMPNRLMLDIMRKSRDGVIFGLDSFWEGVDVRGDALKSLIITKLPFEVPTEPIVQARTEEIAKGGGNPFPEYSLPRAVLKFRQGFGRLIRSRDDRGRVIVCDERLETRAYGEEFRKVLEPGVARAGYNTDSEPGGPGRG